MPRFSRVFNKDAANRIVIAGGGLAGLFTAYELLSQARRHRRSLDVTLIAERLSSPSAAGSHVVLEQSGLFHADMPDKARKEFSTILRAGMDGLEKTIRMESIDCSFVKGYEWKSKTRKALSAIIDDAIRKKIYRPDEFNFDVFAQDFTLPGYRYGARLESIGQVNVPALLNGLVERIRAMGGKVFENERYASHEKTGAHRYRIHTGTGATFMADRKPVMATGADHMRTLPGFNLRTHSIYTMSAVFGPLSEDDRRRVAHAPVAFCDTNQAGDVLWGGIDDKGRLTLGRGENPTASIAGRDALTRDIIERAETILPGILDRYIPHTTYKSMMVADNHLPIVGRMAQYDVLGGWGGEGIVPGYAAARAYALWVLMGDDRDLKIFESLQPAGTFLSPHAGQRPGQIEPHVA